MARLVALDLPGGPRFVDELRRVWDRGDAVFPLDRRLPAAARRTALDAMAPTRCSTRTASTRSPHGRPVEPGDALVVATSGSTGVPKGVVLTHDAVAASAAATSARLGAADDDHWLACLPLAHVGGLSVVTRALHTGTALTVHGRVRRRAVVARCGGRGDAGVARRRLRWRGSTPRLFRTVVLGGARMPEALPPNVVTTYGMTETGSGVVYDGVPLGGVDVRLDPDGEIHLRGPMLLRCYRDGTVPLVDGGWLPTGDAGAWDADGRLLVHGRRGELIITGGENVWPQPVEQVLATAAGVRRRRDHGHRRPGMGPTRRRGRGARDPGAPPHARTASCTCKELAACVLRAPGAPVGLGDPAHCPRQAAARARSPRSCPSEPPDVDA